MKKIIALLSFLPVLAFAQEAQPEVPVEDLLALMLKAIGDYKALGWQAGLSAIVVLIIASMKNSFLRKYIWDKLGNMKVFVAPVLSLVLVVLGSIKMGHPIDAKVLLLGLVTGAGALALHEILDGVKAIPGIGPKWVMIIDLIGKVLKKPEQKA